MLELARALQASGHVDVVDVNDNPRARARMSGLIASATIERVVGLETIPHLTPRDASIAGLESMLLGAHAEGIRNVLAVTGDPPEAGDYPGARGVYEVDSIGLSQMITRMNAGEDYNGREIDAPTSFFLGVAVNPAADDLDSSSSASSAKLEAGAQFAMTQVLFDLSYLESFLERLGGTCPIPLLVGIFYVRSYQLALRLHNEVPGIVVPEHVQDRLRDAGSDARRRPASRSHASCSRRRASVAAGVYVIPPFRQPHAALDLSRRAVARVHAARSASTRLSTRLRASSEPSRTSVGRDPVAARLARPPREHRRAHATLRVDARAARASRLDRAADRRTSPPHRPAAVRVAAEHVRAVPPSRAGVRGERPVLRIADERDRHAALRIGDAERPAAEPRHAQHGHVVRSRRMRPPPRRTARAAARVDPRRSDARDDVRVRHDEPARRATQPEPSTPSPHAMP